MIDELNPVVVQVVRSVVQAAWTAVLSLSGVPEFLDGVGVESEAPLGILIPVVLGLVVLIGRYIGKLHPWLDILVNGIPRKPEYALAA